MISPHQRLGPSIRRMLSTLYRKVIYMAPIDYLINNSIVEYDISKANINILFYYGLLTQDQYNYYYNLPKKQREIALGYIQKNEKYSKAVKEGIVEFKRRFFEANQIEDYQVLSIKNDAVFLIDKEPKITKFDNVEFARKESYTSYYRLGRIECYYYYDFFKNTEYMTIKGMSEEKQALHDKYFIDFLKCLFNSAQMDSLTETIELLKDFHEDYVNMKLEMPYYREFNAMSSYSIKPAPNSYRIFKASHLDPKNINFIDTQYNEKLLRDLYKMYASMYFSRT